MKSDVPQTVVDLLQLMVRCDTVNTALSGQACPEAELSQRLQSLAESVGFATRRLAVEGQADNLLIRFEVDPSRPWLLFDSHLDTVSTDGMSIDPFGAGVEDGRLYGRGSCDTKGTGAAMLWALKAYAADKSTDRPNNVALLYSVDEEVTMTGIRSFVENDLPKLGFRPVGAVVGEPTMHQPVIAHNGCLRWRITTHGVAAHSAIPDAGMSAISMMAKVVRAIESNYIARLTTVDRLTGSAACSINMIHGGTAPNVIPNACHIEIDRRLVPGENADDVLPAVDRVIEPVKQQHPDLKYSQQVVVQHPPLIGDDSGDLLGAIQKVLSRFNLPPRPLGAPFATNAGYLARAGVPTVIIGPGDPFKAHTEGEWIGLDQLHQGVEVYRAIMQQVV